MPDRVNIPAEIERLARTAVDAAFSVHTELGPGLLESAYEDCFVHELQLRGLTFTRQVLVPLNYKGVLISTAFRADVIIESKLLIEIKAIEQPLPIHKAQVITYLKLLKMPLGLMMNFNELLIRDGITRVLNFPKSLPKHEKRVDDKEFRL